MISCRGGNFSIFYIHYIRKIFCCKLHIFFRLRITIRRCYFMQIIGFISLKDSGPLFPVISDAKAVFTFIRNFKDYISFLIQHLECAARKDMGRVIHSGL